MASFVYFLLLFFVFAAAAFWHDSRFEPARTRIAPDYGAEKPVILGGEILEGSAIGEGETLKLPLPLLVRHVDPSIWFEEESSSVIISTETKVVRLVSEQLTAWVNDRPFELRFPAEIVDGTVYVPVAPLAELYGLHVEEAPETGFVILRLPGETWTLAAPKEPEDGADEGAPSAAVRVQPALRAPLVDEIRPGEHAVVYGETEGWYWVRTERGLFGYADKRDLVYAGTARYDPPDPAEGERFVAPRRMGERVFLVWEQVYSRNPNTAAIGPMPGLNVVSPTWFHLLDAEGTLENRADAAYVEWAHGRGYQVWALFSNSFDPDLTAEALSTHDRRMNMARQLLGYAQLYKLDGINVDFENVYVKDGPLLTQFMRELTPLLHEAGLTVSIDVTFAGGSATWSQFLDRKALGEIVDYMMVMAYDEHWASSPVAGSVASLPWVEQGVRRIVENIGVPAKKVVLGVPFYTRIWTEKTENGKTSVSSRAVGMNAVASLLRDRKLTPVFDEAAGQHYVEYEEGGARHRIWIEDEMSVKARAELVNKLGLAGIAAWSRNFASESIWTTIDETLNGP